MRISRIGRFRFKLFNVREDALDFRLIDTSNGIIISAPTTYASRGAAVRDAKQIVASIVDEENYKPWRLFFSDGSSVFIGQFRRQRKFKQKRR